jgi:hypothetical protein
MRCGRIGNFTFPVVALLLVATLCSLPAVAEHTRFWRQSDYEEFDQGTAHGVALRSDGRLLLAPKFAPFGDSNLAYLWSLRTDSHGNLYAAGGSNAKVVRFDSAGRATSVFESTEMTAQAIALDKADNLYVGTSPDGKVYRVTPDGKQSVFFDPKMKYIWDLALGPDGTLYVATGDTGKIFAVTPDGKGDVFYTGEETHIRVITLDGKGNLLAGTEPNGRVLRIPLAAPSQPAARRDSDRAKNAPASASATDSGRSAYVIYETAKKEITSLVLDPSGNLYVSAIGDKTRPLQGSPQLQSPAPQAQPNAAPAAQNGATIAIGAPNLQPQSVAAFVPFPALNSSSVYRIATDGTPQEIWSGRDDLVYTMSLDASGKLLLGTGSQGAIIELDGDGVFSRLAKTESAQVTSFVRAPNGKIFVAAANPGKVFTLGPELESEGTFESQTFDAHNFSRWGRLTWWGTGSGVELYVRSGNTSDRGSYWSPWAGPYRNANGQEVESPAARFVQWKAVLRAGGTPPEISWVNLAYLPKNVAPRIGEIEVQNPGVRLSTLANQSLSGPGQQVSAQLRVPLAPGSQPTAGNSQRSNSESNRFDTPPQGFLQKGYESVLWSADDPNDDDLTYAIYYRGEGEQDWKLLKDHLDQKAYSWDTTSMPDGAYYLKIVASDERSNPPDQALKTERMSDRFVVDNTPPVIADVASQPAAGGSATVRFRATDATSAVVRAQYSVDAGDWMLAEPTGGLSDSLEERYSLTLEGLPPGEHTVALRAYDQFDNEAAAKATFTIPAGKR